MPMEIYKNEPDSMRAVMRSLCGVGTAGFGE